MFEAKIDTGVLKESMDAVTAVVEEGKLKITEEGFKLRAVDPANVAMVFFELHHDAFDDFNLDLENEAEIEIGVDFVKLTGILGIGGRGEVELRLDEHGQKLFIQIGSLFYTISLLDTSAVRKEPKIPDLEFSTQIGMNTDDFRQVIKASEKIGDRIKLGVDDEVFYMETEGDQDKVRLELRKDQLLHLTPGVLHSTFSLNYISAMNKGMGKAESVMLNMSKDYPMQIEFELAEGKGKIGYLLAPWVESE
jgi:proliferating cell nuclear antigen